MAPVSLNGVPMSDIAGPFLLGVIWSHLLYGIHISQLYTYITHFPKDPVLVKTTVYLLFFLQTMFSFFSTVIAWKHLGGGWGDYTVWGTLGWEAVGDVFTSSLIALTAQLFYMRQIWRLTKNWVVAGLIGTMSVVSCGLMFYTGSRLIILQTYARVLTANESPNIAWNVISTTCNLLISGTLYTYLWRARNKLFTPTHGTNSESISTRTKVSKVMIYTVETGTLTSILASIEIVLWLTQKKSSWYNVPYFLLIRTYAITLMAGLNSRALIYSNTQYADVDSIVISAHVGSAAATGHRSNRAFGGDSATRKSFGNQFTTVGSSIVKDENGQLSVFNNRDSVKDFKDLIPPDEEDQIVVQHINQVPPNALNPVILVRKDVHTHRESRSGGNDIAIQMDDLGKKGDRDS